MLPTAPSFERLALNRVTFGARSVDEAYVQQIGWSAWVESQLAPPPGDDPDLASFLNTQTMHIKYAAATDGSWPTVDEMRPLDYINASTSTLWNLWKGTVENPQTESGSEVYRIRQELAAATWIRNAHSHFQLREFMTDFWHNHFNIGKAAHEYATAVLPVYDRAVIRPNVFGNFRQLLEATANSTSMMAYLDNWLSQASTPNENYAREVLELHTLGAGAYLGLTDPGPLQTQSGQYTVTAGFTDQDVTQASRALSGWTLANGQRAAHNVVLPVTGEFIYNSVQHNTQAGTFMGINIAPMKDDMVQGNAVLDIAAYHPATAAFIVGKLCRRIFGDTPPAAVLTRAQNVWMANQTAPNQIQKVLETILLDGPEVGTGPAVKLRRPYEHLIALFRTTDMVVNANPNMTAVLDPVTDGLFAWTPPNGRPDNNAYWQSSGAIMAEWNNAYTWPHAAEIQTNLASQTPSSAASSATGVVEYWVGRMIGSAISSTSMNALVTDQSGPYGVPAYLQHATSTENVENMYRRLVTLITQTAEYLYR
ncbi:MAG: DUF1800 domain-containing protein [Rhodospirillaceae bacterium]|nr:MAG: DUF1800 domain-containing protein [Rhodospirillaceae bacterium]